MPFLISTSFFLADDSFTSKFNDEDKSFESVFELHRRHFSLGYQSATTASLGWFTALLEFCGSEETVDTVNTVHVESLHRVFIGYAKNLLAKQEGSPSLFKNNSWQDIDPTIKGASKDAMVLNQRRKFMDHLWAYANKFPWNKGKDVAV